MAVQAETSPVPVFDNELYRDLWFVGAASRFLAESMPQNIEEQLKSRRIVSVIFTRLERLSSGSLIVQDGNFAVLIQESQSLEQNAKDLGYAVGSTFQYNLTYTPPRVSIDQSLLFRADVFSFHFASLWTERVGSEAVKRFFDLIQLVNRLETRTPLSTVYA